MPFAKLRIYTVSSIFITIGVVKFTGTIRRFVLATMEDTVSLRQMNRKSQLIPASDGRIYPSVHGMTSINEMGKTIGVQISITHMFTSYLDESKLPPPLDGNINGNGMTKKSIILIRSAENNKIICQSHMEQIPTTAATVTTTVASS